MSRPLALGVALCFTILALLSGSALAEAPAWTYVELGYSDVDLDNLDESGDGWFAEGSYGFKHFHIIGRYGSEELDTVDRTNWYLGAGWHGALGEKADIIGEVAYVDAELDFQDVGPISTASDDGYFLRAGIRWRPIKVFEIAAWYRYQDLSNFGSQNIWEANAIFHIWKLGLGLGYETESDVDSFNGFVRWSFR